MKVAFTICSNNYLAKAKVVVDSFMNFHPEYVFYIFLVDKLDAQIDYAKFAKAEIVEVQSVVSDIEPLALKYNIIELNTAVKPDIFLHLFHKYQAESIIYLDPDLMIYDRFLEVENILLQPEQNMVITPHFCSPIDDGKYPSEIDFACFGLYNLGFIAIKNSAESIRFLEWWRQRLMKYCYIKPAEGMFTDQLWVNIAPIFFNGMYILKHLGYNVANWNLYERDMSLSNNHWYVNRNERLKFIHFSQYEYNNPYSIAKYQNRHVIEDRPDMKELIDMYQQQLVQNKFEDFTNCECFYQRLYQDNLNSINAEKNSIVKKVKRRLKRYTRTSKFD